MGKLRARLARPSYEIQALGALLLIGLLLRLTIAPYGEYVHDTNVVRGWATTLANQPITDFYAMDPTPDHLPGDIWVLWAITHVYQSFSPQLDLQAPGFLFLLKLVPALADVGAAVMLFLIASRFAGRTKGLFVAAIFVFNPAVIFLSSIWGQWDSLSVFAALTAFWLFLSGRLMWSLPVLTYAALIKPQFLALFPLLLLATFFARHDETRPSSRAQKSRKRRGIEVAAGLGFSLVLAAILLLPFNVGVPPLGRWNLFERVRFAVDHWPYATMYALNLWSAVQPPANHTLQPDDATWILGLSYRVWGTILAGAAYVAVLGLYARHRDDRALLWASAAIMLALFLLPTRVHERYMLPGLTFMALLTLFTPTFRTLYAGLSLTLLVNLFFAFSLFNPPDIVADAARSRFFFVFFSLLNVAMFIVVLLADLRLRFGLTEEARDGEERRDERSAAATELSS